MHVQADASGHVNQNFSALWNECGQKILARPQHQQIHENNIKSS